MKVAASTNADDTETRIEIEDRGSEVTVKISENGTVTVYIDTFSAIRVVDTIAEEVLAIRWQR